MSFLRKAAYATTICLAAFSRQCAYSSIQSMSVSQESNWLLRRSSIDLSLYLIANRATVSSDDDLLRRVAAAVDGGVTCVQLRDLDRPREEILALAQRVKNLLDEKRVAFIMNTYVDIALSVNAAGLHMEKGYEAYPDVRSALGEKAIIGRGYNSEQELLDANHQDWDYISTKIFESRTCPLKTKCVGLEGLETAQKLSRHRLVAIGGIGLTNISEIFAKLNLQSERQHGIAMIGDLWKSDDPMAAAQALLAARNG